MYVADFLASKKDVLQHAAQRYQAAVPYRP